MKLLFPALISFPLVSFQPLGHFSLSSNFYSDPIAVLCNDTWEGTIQKSDLMKCGGIRIIDSKTYEDMCDFRVSSFQVITLLKDDNKFLIENPGASFNDLVQFRIQQLQSGDQIIFRKIKMRDSQNIIRPMNSIVLKIQ